MAIGNLVLGLSKHESIVISNGTETIVLRTAAEVPKKKGSKPKFGRRIAIEASKDWKIYRVKNRDRGNGSISLPSDDAPRVPKVSLGLKRRRRDDERRPDGGDPKNPPRNDVRGGRGDSPRNGDKR